MFNSRMSLIHVYDQTPAPFLIRVPLHYNPNFWVTPVQRGRTKNDAELIWLDRVFFSGKANDDVDERLDAPRHASRTTDRASESSFLQSGREGQLMVIDRRDTCEP